MTFICSSMQRSLRPTQDVKTDWDHSCSTIYVLHIAVLHKPHHITRQSFGGQVEVTNGPTVTGKGGREGEWQG